VRKGAHCVEPTRGRADSCSFKQIRSDLGSGGTGLGTRRRRPDPAVRWSSHARWCLDPDRGRSDSGVGDTSRRGSTTNDAVTSTGHSTGGGTSLGDEDCIFTCVGGSSPNFTIIDKRRSSQWCMRWLGSSNLSMMRSIVVVVVGSTVLAMAVMHRTDSRYQLMWIWLRLGTRAVDHDDQRSLLYGTSSSMIPNTH
jgi:hypothetical protein